MKIYNRLTNSIQSFSNALLRFPLTAAFLVAIAALDAMVINNNEVDYLERYIISLVVGACLSAVLQLAYERFCIRKTDRIVSMAITVILTVGYYLTIMNEQQLSQEVLVKTSVVVFGLIIAFLWIPSIKSKITFNECFVSGFKAFFLTLLFSWVLMIGFSIIYYATDMLLFNLNEDIYLHTANIVFVVFAVLYFLSLTPKYPGAIKVQKEDGYAEELLRATSTPKILEVLISYIVIPLSMIFTLILLVYIAINISSSFWTDALLEPMLVSYIVAVILIYILASRMENRMAIMFRKIFPKVLLPIVVFQTINSILRINDFGLTYGRYYAILFGIFAFIAALVFSLKPVEKNGIVPMVLIICVVISVIPMIDAFTISKNSQISMLENVLIENEMLVDNRIIPKEDIDDLTKKRIIASTEYIRNMGYAEEIEWMPKEYDEFEATFGFPQYEQEPMEDGYFSLGTDGLNDVVNIAGYDFLIETHISNFDYGEETPNKYEFEKNNKKYSALIEEKGNEVFISLNDSGNKEIVSMKNEEIIKKIETFNLTVDSISIKDAYIISENEKGTINILIKYINGEKNDKGYNFNAEIYIFIRVK